jgi:hypothetical protein
MTVPSHIHPVRVRPEYSADWPSKQKEDSGSGYAHALVAQDGFVDEGCS